MRALTTGPRSASVVIPACNEGSMLELTVSSILAADTALPLDIIIVDDGSTDGSCDAYRGGQNPKIRVVNGDRHGVGHARNLGAEHATGEMLVFLDAHCEVSSRWLDHLANSMRAVDVAIVTPGFTRLGETSPIGMGVGWASPRLDIQWFLPVEGVDRPYEVPLAPGGCQAFPSGTFRAIGRFDEGFARWGSEDIEISLRAWLLGYRVVTSPQVRIAHWFRDTRGFEVDEVDVAFNLLRMVRLHFTEPRLSRIVSSIGSAPVISHAEQLLADSDVHSMREELLAVRDRDDAWFCDTFFPELFGASDR